MNKDHQEYNEVTWKSDLSELIQRKKAENELLKRISDNFSQPEKPEVFPPVTSNENDERDETSHNQSH